LWRAAEQPQFICLIGVYAAPVSLGRGMRLKSSNDAQKCIDHDFRLNEGYGRLTGPLDTSRHLEAPAGLTQRESGTFERAKLITPG